MAGQRPQADPADPYGEARGIDEERDITERPTKKPAIFVDRDGVLNVFRAGGYVFSREDVRFLPGAMEAVARLSRAGRRVVVITNQSGIARGLYGPEDVQQVHTAMQEAVTALGGHFAGLYFCPHCDDDACDCRKPLPGLLRRAAEDLDVDLARSVFVGDSETDVLAGRAAGCRTYAVASGMSSPEAIASWPEPPDAVFAALSDAVEALLEATGDVARDQVTETP